MPTTASTNRLKVRSRNRFRPAPHMPTTTVHLWQPRDRFRSSHGFGVYCLRINAVLTRSFIAYSPLTRVSFLSQTLSRVWRTWVVWRSVSEVVLQLHFSEKPCHVIVFNMCCLLAALSVCIRCERFQLNLCPPGWS